MNKLECLEKLISKNVNLDNDFKLIMDSKKASENSLFFAINNGNKFANEAEQKGSFVIYDDKSLEIKNGHYVKDTVKFMQEFAKLYRKERDFLLIAITGSNGKTTLKDILYSLLKQKNEKVTKTQGNYNNHIGLPFSILSANDDDKILILEMGMSNLGEIDLLGNIAKPNYSIITNIGHSHLEQLKTRENVFKAKTELIAHTKNLVYVNEEDEFLKKINLDNVKKVKLNDISSNLKGRHNMINVSLAKAILEDLGYENLDFSNLQISQGRFEQVCKKYLYINDAYNASPLSMRASIETFSSLHNDKYKIICLADMLELGEDEIKYHEDLSEVIEKCNFDTLMLYGDKMRYLYIKLRKIYMDKLANNIKVTYTINHYKDKENLKKDINRIKTNKKLAILLKGSRSMKMEEIMEEKE